MHTSVSKKENQKAVTSAHKCHGVCAHVLVLHLIKTKQPTPTCPRSWPLSVVPKSIEKYLRGQNILDATFIVMLVP